MMYYPQTHIPLRSILGVLQIGIKSQDTVMSDSEDFTVTYTEVSSLFEDLSDIGSPGVVGPEYEGLPWMLDDPYVHHLYQHVPEASFITDINATGDEVLPTEEQPLPADESSDECTREVSSPFEGLSDIGSPGVAPPSPDYMPGPEEPEQAPPLPDFVPEPVYPEFMPLEDEEDPEEDPADYPADGRDNDDDKDESFDDDEDDDVDIKGDEEEEEHPTPADSTTVALPAVDHAPFAEETGPFKIDESAATPPPHPAYCVTARMSIRDKPPTPFWSEAEIARLLAIPSPPPSPLSPWSSPLPQIPSPPLPVSPPSPVSPPPLLASPTYPLGYRAAMIWLRAEAPSTSHPLPLPLPIVLPRTKASVAMLRDASPSTYILAPRSEAPPSGIPPLLPIPLHTPSPPLLLPSTDHRADVCEACLLPQKRLCLPLV
ncbi:hypothetical protein Tco_0524772 [Tanacetum coccineum]